MLKKKIIPELVIWEDIVSGEEGWLYPGTKGYNYFIEEDNPYMVKQIGFIVKETKTHIVMSSTVVESDGALSQLTSIPKAVIKKRYKLEKKA